MRSTIQAVDDLERRRRGFVRDPLDPSGALHLYVERYVVMFVRDGKLIRVVDVRRR
jgi:hypothetical protein